MCFSRVDETGKESFFPAGFGEKMSQKKTRAKALKALKKCGGKLIEPKYTKNISSSLIKLINIL